MVRAVIVFLVGCSAWCCACLAQERDRVRETVEWIVSLRGRMAQMANPVVRVHGTASLARTVCPVDPSAASGLYREAISSLFNLPDGAFGERGTTVLPVGSFSGLWKYVIPAALKCDPGLVAVAENQRARERMTAERTGANATLRRALEVLNSDKRDMADRAAQIGGAALEAADPETLDIALLSSLLSTLNGTAPDLADDLFLRSLEFVMSSPAPSPDSLQSLAKFLLTAADASGKPNEDQGAQSYTVAGATVEKLTAARSNANPDNIEALIETTLRLLDIPAAVNRNPVVAYALAYQLLPRARDLMPDRAPDLEKAVAQLQAENANAAAQVQAKVGAPGNPDPESGDPAARISWLIRQIRGALAAGQIERARELLPGVADLPARGQLKALIDFEEAARAAAQHNDQAVSMANQLRPGIKRSLLYIAIIANMPGFDTALSVLPLAARDLALLPAEQRVILYSALSAALLRTDVDSALGVMNQLVAACNDVRVSPRRGKFDPASVRRTYSPGSSTGTDSALILAGRGGLYEAVQTERGRQNFVLRAPRADAFSLAAFLGAAAAVDPDRLAAIILGLRDENTQAGAWVELAEVRLKEAGKR
jgi:hypothetical protein